MLEDELKELEKWIRGVEIPHPDAGDFKRHLRRTIRERMEAQRRIDTLRRWRIILGISTGASAAAAAVLATVMLVRTNISTAQQADMQAAKPPSANQVDPRPVVRYIRVIPRGEFGYPYRRSDLVVPCDDEGKPVEVVY